MADDKPQEEVQKKPGFFAGLTAGLWDKENKLFFGRSGKNWAKLTVFYLIFYACLALFWAAMIAAFYATIDDNKPKLTGKSSRLKGSPSVGFRPTPDYETTLIKFDPDESSSFDQYVNNLEAYLKDYDEENIHGDTKVCGPGDEGTESVACQVNVKDFLVGPCAKENYYGYRRNRTSQESSPCVLLRLNKIYDWKPQPVDGSEGEVLGSRLSAGHVGVNCIGENPADKENIGQPVYYPAEGWPSYYFPYLNQKAYRSPVVMVTFPKLPVGILIMVQCRAYAKNIEFDEVKRLGMAHFELYIEP